MTTLNVEDSVRSAAIYRAFGLRIASRMALPELPLADEGAGGREPGAGEADVTIETADAERLMAELRGCGTNFAYSRERDRFLFLIPETAVFGIERGRRIAVAPLPGADPERVRVYLLGTCMGALLLMRRILPLHGSAVAVGGRAYAFVGDSGAGKSTLAAACAAKGHRLLSDDVAAVAIGADGKPYALPAYPQQKLWRESLEGLGLASGAYRTIYRETGKFAVPAATRFGAAPVPLAGVFELHPQTEAALPPKPGAEADWRRIAIERLTGLEHVHLLMRHTYRNRLVPRLGLEEWHFRVCTAVGGQIEACRLRRPTTGFTAEALAETIERLARGEERV